MKLRTLTCLGLWLGLAVPAFAADKISISPAQQQNLGIGVTPVEATTTAFGRQLPAQVVIPPTAQRLISAPQSGLVSQLKVAVGDEVKSGQQLLTLQSPEIVALQRDFLQALSQQRLTQAALERDDALFKEGVIAKRRFLETESRAQEQNAALEERRQSLLLAGMAAQDIKRLEQTRKLGSAVLLRSPIKGIVLERLAETGQRVETNAPLYRIGQLGTLWLEIRAPVEALPGLQVGAHLQVMDKGIKGSLILIGREVDPASQTVLLRAEVSEGSEQLRPGQYVQVSLNTQTGSTSYRVPAGAVVRNNQQTYVFVQTADGFTPLPVTVWVNENGYAVVSGQLQGNEKVAVSGIAAIKGAWMGLGGGE